MICDSQLQFNPGDALLRACEAAAVRRADDFKPQDVVRVGSPKHNLHEQESAKPSAEQVVSEMNAHMLCHKRRSRHHPCQINSHLTLHAALCLARLVKTKQTLQMWVTFIFAVVLNDCIHKGFVKVSGMSVASMAARAQSNFVWAYATLDERIGAACLKALAAHAQEELPQFKAQGLSNMMWAFAKLSYTPGEELLQSCEAHATRLAGAFIPQELVRCCLFLFQLSLYWRVAHMHV